MDTLLLARLLTLVFALAHGQPVNVDQANAVIAQAQYEVSNGCNMQYCDMPINPAGEITVPTSTVENTSTEVFLPAPSLPAFTGYDGSVGSVLSGYDVRPEDVRAGDATTAIQ